VLRLDRLRGLRDVYPGVGSRRTSGRRLRLLPARTRWCLPFDRHRHARPARCGARRPPSHPDSGIALRDSGRRRSVDAGVFRRVAGRAWVPWRRPGFQLGLDIAAIAAANPRATSAVILGGHGIHRLGRDERGVRSPQRGDHPGRRGLHRGSGYAPSRSARSWQRPWPTAERRARAAACGAGHPWVGVDRSAADRALRDDEGGARFPQPG